MTQKTKVRVKNSKKKGLLWLSNDRVALLTCLLFGLAYYFYSLISNGYYQQDELAHYISMRGFWKDPNSILSNWAKPGYKLIYIWPALLGVQALKIFNIVLSLSVGYFAYLTAKKMRLKYAFLALILLLSQPFWIQLSFRNYSEHLTALCYLSGIYFLTDKRYFLTAIVISYGCFLRQETYPIALLFIGFMLFQKQYLPILLLAVFPVLHNLWGWSVSGNPSYLIDMMVGTSAEYASMYPRQGFDHYFLMSPAIFGYIVVIFSIGYLLVQILRKEVPSISAIILWLTLLAFAAQHVVFNSQFLDIGPSTGGNLRYFNVIAPLASIAALMGFEKVLNSKDRKKVVAILTIITLITLYFTAYDHNYIKYIEDRNWIAGLPILVVLGLFGISKGRKTIILGVIVAMVAQCFLMVKPLRISGEDALAKSVANYIIDNASDGAFKVASTHATCHYFLYDHTSFIPYNMEEFDKLNSGDWIIWDSHYGPRNKIEYQDLLNDKEKFVLVKQEMTDDKRFATILFQRK